MHTTRAQVVAWMAFAWTASVAGAQPIVRIGAEARIELEVERRGDGARLKAKLLDDQARALAGLPLTLEARTPSGQRVAGRHDLRTDREGEVEIAIAGGVERVIAVGVFEGDAFHAQARQEAIFDLGLAPVDLSFVEPRSSVLDLGLSTHSIALRARSEAGAAELPLSLQDENDRVLAELVLDALGSARVELTAQQLGAPGIGVLRAHTPGDVARAPASAELAIVRWSATSLSLELEPHEGEVLKARGVLRAGSGPVPHATVSLFDARELHVASFVTDAEGRFAGVPDAAQLAAAREASDGALMLRARFVSDVPWLGSSESVPREARFEAKRGWRQAWALATPIAIGILLFALRRRGARRAEPLRDAPRAAGVSHGQALRLRGAMSISFRVLDARSGKLIPDAHALLTSATGDRFEAASMRGAIELVARAAGEHVLHVSAQGFRPLECTLRAPHHGEWTHASVRLQSLRDAALAAWHPVATQVAPSIESASASTVRETLERAAQSAHVAGDHAQALVSATEHAAYAATTPSADGVAQLESQAATLARAIEDKRRV